jgi:hypothetical protein
MSIALWDTMNAASRPPRAVSATPRDGHRRWGEATPGPLVRPPSELQDLILLQDDVGAALAAIESLERQVQVGLSDSDTAYLLAWLEPFVAGRLSLDQCGRGAAVLTRAAADHATLTMLGLSWFETAFRRRVPIYYLAEAALNISVAFAARRRYAEAEDVLDRLLPVVRDDRHATVLLRVGKSAWRRRILSDSLEGGRGFDSLRLREISRAAIEQASGAIKLLEPDQGRHPVPFLRTEIRLAEALALTSALVSRSSGGVRGPLEMVRTNALRLRDNSHAAMDLRRRETTPTAYDRARLEVIDEVAARLERGEQITYFGVLRRVRAIQEREEA